MGRVKLYENGLSGGIGGMIKNDVGGKRGVVKGWCGWGWGKKRKLVGCVDVGGVRGGGVGLRVRVGDWGDSGEDWEKIGGGVMEGVGGGGMVGVEWVREWEGRGVGDVDGIVYLGERYEGGRVMGGWVGVGERYGCWWKCEEWVGMSDMEGWFV